MIGVAEQAGPMIFAQAAAWRDVVSRYQTALEQWKRLSDERGMGGGADSATEIQAVGLGIEQVS